MASWGRCQNASNTTRSVSTGTYNKNDDATRIKALIQARTDQLKQQSEQMWQEVYAVIDQCESRQYAVGAARSA